MSERADDDAPQDESLSLWHIASTMSVTAQFDSRRAEKARHGKPRRRRSAGVLFVIGLGFLLIFGASLLPDLSHWIEDVDLLVLLRAFPLLAGVMVLAMSGVIVVGDRAYHSLSKGTRALSLTVWWLSGIFAVAFSWLAMLGGVFSIADPRAAWESQEILNVLALVAPSFVLAMMTNSLATPLLTTLKKPRLYQARWSQTIWICVLVSSLLAAVCSAVSFLLFQQEGATGGDPNNDMIVLVVTIGLGLVGSVVHWYGKNIKLLKQYREDALQSIGHALDILGRENVSKTALMESARALRRALTPSPFRSQSIAALPLLASYEVVETIKLIEWAAGPDRGESAPKSIESRKLLRDGNAEVFQEIDICGPGEVCRDAPNFLARCYSRLLDGTQ